MKKQNTFLAWRTSVLPMLLLALFVLFNPVRSWADVTAEWTQFPSGTDTKNGVTISEHLTYCPFSSWLVCSSPGNMCIFEPGDSEYFDITISEGVISQIQACVWYGNTGSGKTYIKFCAATSFDGSVLETIEIPSHASNVSTLAEVNAPSGAKSARLYSDSETAMTHLIVITADEVACSAPVTVSYAKFGSETGSTPANREVCTDNTSTITLPGKNTLVYDTKHVFVGWEKGGVTYAEGETYTITAADISAGSIEFTAVWRELSVTNFTADKSGNYNVALAWSIPGICDLSKATTASGKATNDGTNVLYGSNTSIAYDDLTNVVTAVGYSPQYGQYGVAFPIPETNGVETITIDCKGNSLPSGITLWGGIMNGTQAYWDYDDNLHYYAPSAWSKQIFTIDSKYWSGSYSSSTSVSYVGIYANAAANTDGVSFSVREARYHVSGFEDIHHVVLMRKVGSAATDTTETTGCVKLYSGTNSWFIDNAEKEAGDYYYSVFAVYNDGGHSVSSAIIADPIEIESIKVDPELSATLTNSLLLTTGSTSLVVNTADAYTGTLEYTVSPAGIITLNESTGAISAVAAGTATITVTAPATDTHYADSKSVELQVIALPETNLALDASGDDVELSWNIPGIIDLRTAKTTPSIDSYGNCTSKELSISNNNEELTVTYSAVSGWTDNAFSFDVNISNIESLSFEYHGDYTGGVWSGIYPILYCQNNTSSYWDSSKGTHGLSATEWTSKGASEFVLRGSGSAFDASQTYTEILFVASDEGEVSNGHMYLRNVRYHTTGMVDIDHIVIMRTTDAAATDTVSGTKLYSGRMFHYTDAALPSGIYYYTIFAVYEDGCVPVEYKTFDNRSFTITYKDQGDAEFSGVHATDYPTTHKGSATTNLKKASKDGYAFGGWYTAPACTGDAINVLDADAYDADITLYARWIEMNLHTPGKYELPTSEGGYGRILKNKNSHDYEVYMVTYDAEGRECNDQCDNKNGELYAGPVTEIHDGYRMFSGAGNTELQSSDAWMAFKPYKYYGTGGTFDLDEFQKLNVNSGIGSSRYARIGDNYYVRLYVQGYAEFAFAGKDANLTGDNFIVRIDGISQAYSSNTEYHVARFSLTTEEPHFIEIIGSSSSTSNYFRGFSLQLPDVDRYTVTIAKNENSYGAVSAASIANVRTGSPVYVNDNTVYVAGTTIEATPTESNAQYSYAFNNWTVGGAAVPATITAATTVTANFTRAANDYTLTWNLNGGTVTTAGTGADVDATGTPSSSVAYGIAITAPVVEKEGYRFIGWNVTPAATMPAENVTYTAQWAAPMIIGTGTTTFDYLNVYKPTAPDTYDMNVDGVEGDETCLDIKDQGQADWWVKMSPTSYRVVVKYGTPSGCVKVKVQVIDAETGTQVAQTEIDEHCSGTVFMAAWAMDLGELIDADKTYYIRVKDAYESTGSKPKVGIVEITPIEPLPITTAATKRLDYENVAVPYQIMPFDIENDGVNETCLFIGNQHQADWKVTIVPDVYNIKIRYGKPDASTNLTLYLLDEDGGEVWKSAARTTPSGRYETWEIKGVDLTNEVNKDAVYTIRIKDTYGSDGSKPYIEYIDVIPAVVKIPAETRLDATNTYSSVDIKTDVNFDDDDLTTDNSMNLNGTQADYVVQIQPGYYNVSLVYGAPEYSVRVAVTLTDPTGAEEVRYLSTNPYYYESGSAGVEHHHISSMKCDLTGLDGNKSYRLHITDEYGTSNNLRVSHLQFSPIEPVLIANNTILNSTNTVTFNAPTQEFNVDGEEGNETCLLVSQHYGVSPLEWSVNVTPGVYDLNVHFGNNAASDGGYDMTIYLVDPETPESPVSLYHKRVNDGTSLSCGVARCDFSGLAADKDYIIRVVDNWNGSKLRVGDIKFVTPAPLQIPNVTRLNASNVYVTPHYGKQPFNIEGEGEIECLNIRYQGEAAWFANMMPYVYNITLKYGKPSAGVKVLFGIIDVESGETIYSQQFVDYTEGAITYTQNFNADLTDKISADKLYKLFIKDNHGSDGSEPRVAYIDIARYTITHTRSNLHAGDFGTVCLPYAVEAANISGAEIYKLIEWPAGSCAVTLEQVDNMEAGHPYIYQATANTATWRYYPEGDPTDATSENGLIGSYVRTLIEANANNYIIYNNKLYYVDSNAYVGVNKAYINRKAAENAPAPAPANGRKRIQMGVNGTQTATGVGGVQLNSNLQKVLVNGQLFIIRDGKTYTAQGQLVTR